VDTIYVDNELGKFIIRVNPRARRLVFRTREDAVYVSVPPGTTHKEFLRSIEELRPRLRKARGEHHNQIIDLNFRIDADFFKLSLAYGVKPSFLATSRPGEMTIICPADTDFKAEEVQQWLRKVIGEALRKNAKIILPGRLQELATQYGFVYRQVRINSSRSRWGSCSGSGNINLSYLLMVLPSHLIDYVLLHELCHTREMNHSDRFWALMDEVTDNRAQRLRAELKRVKFSL